ncbi:MAG: alpha/beta hydrolase family protein [Microthrixaceae bacterium]
MTPRGTTTWVAHAALVALLLLASCSGSDRDVGADRTTTSAATSSIEPTTTTVPEDGCDAPRAAGAAAPNTFAVGRRSRTFVDTTRGTDADDARGMAAAADRTLAVSVLYPSAGTPAAPGEFVQDAPAATGEFPLVVYSHGVLSNGSERNDTLARWASAGYVVVAPTFPLSSGPGARIFDLPNQPADVVFVTDSLRTAVSDPSDPLHGIVAGECLALAGHSLGGATTLATAFDPCCAQLDVRAVIDVAGVLLQVTPDASLSEARPIPTMIVHGVRDPLVGYEQGQRTFAELVGPRWLVSLAGGDHNSMFVAPESAALDASALALLDAELKGDPTGLDALPGTLASLGASGAFEVTVESAGPTG